jgi:hypothetical protein
MNDLVNHGPFLSEKALQCECKRRYLRTYQHFNMHLYQMVVIVQGFKVRLFKPVDSKL